MSKEKKSNKKTKQSSLKINQVKEKLWLKWFFMVIFPPYALYYFLFKTKVKWYIKVPVTIFFIFIVIAAIDQRLNPFRVEESLVSKEINFYIKDHHELELGDLRVADRQGAFLWDENTNIVYRTLTTKGLYDFVIVETRPENYEVKGIYQTYPEEKWVVNSDDKYTSQPMAILYLFENNEKIGDIKTFKEEDGKNVVETTKGKYYYTFEKNKVINVKDENGKVILKQKNEYTMPDVGYKYFKKNEDKVGKLIEVFDYKMDEEKEMFYIKSTNGIYRIDDYRDGNINLLKGEYYIK